MPGKRCSNCFPQSGVSVQIHSCVKRLAIDKEAGHLGGNLTKRCMRAKRRRCCLNTPAGALTLSGGGNIPIDLTWGEPDGERCMGMAMKTGATSHCSGFIHTSR